MNVYFAYLSIEKEKKKSADLLTANYVSILKHINSCWRSVVMFNCLMALSVSGFFAGYLSKFLYSLVTFYRLISLAMINRLSTR